MIQLRQLLYNDGDFISVKQNITELIQQFYICTGCDYVSFFKGHGKKSFFNTFIKHIDFISKGQAPFRGMLHQTGIEWELGFLSFLRFVGSEYLKKCSIEFKYQCTGEVTPDKVYLALANKESTDIENHTIFINKIRESLFKRHDEEHYIPTVDCLRYHWRRCCWVQEIWKQADKKVVLYPNINLYGWSINNDKVTVVWDKKENIDKIKRGIRLWTEGCTCTTSCGARCGCRRNRNICCPGCKCGPKCTNTQENSNAAQNIDCLPSTSGNLSDIGNCSDAEIISEGDSDLSDICDDEDLTFNDDIS